MHSQVLPIPPCTWTAVSHTVRAARGAVRLGDATGRERVGGIERVDGPRRVQRRRCASPPQAVGLGEEVLHGLERSDRHAELPALGRVRHREVDDAAHRRPPGRRAVRARPSARQAARSSAPSGATDRLVPARRWTGATARVRSVPPVAAERLGAGPVGRRRDQRVRASTSHAASTASTATRGAGILRDRRRTRRPRRARSSRRRGARGRRRATARRAARRPPPGPAPRRRSPPRHRSRADRRRPRRRAARSSRRRAPPRPAGHGARCRRVPRRSRARARDASARAVRRSSACSAVSRVSTGRPTQTDRIETPAVPGAP